MNGETPALVPPARPPATWRALLLWLKQRQHVLVCAHVRPDGDAVGAVLAATLGLRALGLQATPHFSQPPACNYSPFLPPGLTCGQPLDLAQFDAVLCLDTSNPPRLDLPNGLKLAELKIPVASVDHHLDNPGYGDFQLVDPSRAATCELLGEFFHVAEVPVSPDIATLLLLGLVTDTGGFRFTNVRSHTLRQAAWLRDCGARYDEVMFQVYFNEPLGLLRLRGEIIAGLQFACDQRLVYFLLTPELLARHGLANGDIEDIVDVARVVRGAQLVCRLQQTEEGIRISLRSQNSPVSALQVAKRFGGGGHLAAAGALLRGHTLAQAEALLRQYAQEAFDGTPVAR